MRLVCWLRCPTAANFPKRIESGCNGCEATARLSNQEKNCSRKVWSIVKRLATLSHFLQANGGGKIMIHLIWYIVVGLIAGVIAKSVLHVHMTIFWTIVLGIIGSIIGGAVTHLFSPPSGRFHPAGIIFSTLGAILVLFICLKLHIRFPRVL